MSKPTLLVWHRVYGDGSVRYAECALGTFRTRTKGRRTILTLNDVVIGDHGDVARARAQADRLIEATAEHFARRAIAKAQPAPPPSSGEPA